ncbi:MAG: [FeFe] hydrogenase H-cluster maturation GTPase HydF [bacterium]
MKQRSGSISRLYIAFFGRRNVGKSSLLNALARQQVSIVSNVAGTTTDPVEKPMELLPIGPCLFIDTAGVDDVGALGKLRIEKTRKILDRADIGVIVAPSGEWTKFERQLTEELRARAIPAIVVFNKSDLATADAAQVQHFKESKIPCLHTTATTGEGLPELRAALMKAAPEDWLREPSIAGDLVKPGELAVLVTPIDKEAPKGRMILPQVQTIRDLLDSHAYCMVVRERELRPALNQLKRPPALVITDSQAFLKVAADTPRSIPMTSFSILFARLKGNLNEFVRGAMAIETLKPGSRVLIAESCAHHPIADDIGRVKIPRWLRQYIGGELHCEVYSGHDFPKDLASYHLVVHCGACMTNRREVLSRIAHCRALDVPITNYGMTIAYTLGIFERALEPFPAALEIYRNFKGMTFSTARSF